MVTGASRCSTSRSVSRFAVVFCTLLLPKTLLIPTILTSGRRSSQAMARASSQPTSASMNTGSESVALCGSCRMVGFPPYRSTAME
jgi:hypothetical protein